MGKERGNAVCASAAQRNARAKGSCYRYTRGVADAWKEMMAAISGVQRGW